MKKLMLGSVMSAGLKVASAGLTFLMFMLLARVLGAEEYGLFASMFALGTIGAITALFGQHTLSIKTLAALGDDPERAADRRFALRRSFLITLTGAVLVIGFILGAGMAAPLLGFDVNPLYLIGACTLVIPFALAGCLCCVKCFVYSLVCIYIYVDNHHYTIIIMISLSLQH